MNRRQLFTRLSAVALAPLVKLLPKERFPWCKESYVIGCDVARNDSLAFVAGPGIIIETHGGVATITFTHIPQEEA